MSATLTYNWIWKHLHLIKDDFEWLFKHLKLEGMSYYGIWFCMENHPVYNSSLWLKWKTFSIFAVYLVVMKMQMRFYSTTTPDAWKTVLKLIIRHCLHLVPSTDEESLWKWDLRFNQNCFSSKLADVDFWSWIQLHNKITSWSLEFAKSRTTCD